MTTTTSHIVPPPATASRRQRIGVINRRLGWVILPLVMVATAVHFGPGGTYGGKNTFVFVLQVVFVSLIFVHTVLSVYVFGWVPPRRTLRVFHVWFGYGYVLMVLASQTTFAIEPLHSVLTALMFSCLVVHVGIGVYYARRRRQLT